MTGTTFIDWINIAQSHGGDLPVVGDGVRMTGQSFELVEERPGHKVAILECGKDVRYSVPSLQHRGSHETSLRLRSDGSTVTLSGNAGRFGRTDNVWNYDLGDTVARASECVAAHGLPAFSPGDEYDVQSLSDRDASLGLWTRWTGAAIRELHVTRNYFSGNEKLAAEVMLYFGGLRAARISKGVFGDESVVFGRLAGRGRPLHKCIVIYRKAAEMLAHAKGDDAKKRVRASDEYQLARDVGLVRIECKWGAHFLRDNGCRYLGALTDWDVTEAGRIARGVDMGKLISLFDRETGFLHEVTPDRAARIVSDMPTKVRSSALHWIRGDDLRELLPRATFFRHVKMLREYGIDASEPRGIKTDGGVDQLQRLLDGLPTFELRELPAPDWYRLPEVARAA